MTSATTKGATGAPPRPRGRTRMFDEDQAVDRMIAVFRARGYQATSIRDLAEATGLTIGSLYKAYGDKRGIFIAALDRYAENRRARMRVKLDSVPTGRERLEALLRLYLDNGSGEEGRRGCLIVGSIAMLSAFDDSLVPHIREQAGGLRRTIGELIRQGRVDGSLPATIDEGGTAEVMIALLYGFAVSGKAADPQQAEKIIERAMRLFI